MGLTDNRTKEHLGIGRKAQFLNLSQDGIKIRAVRFKNKKAYNRKDQSWKKG